MTTFDGADLFGSGPSRVRFGRTGRLVLGAFQGQDNPTPNVLNVAVREPEVIQAGRLTGATAAALWSRIEAVRAVAESTAEGVLVTDAGVSIPGLTMLRFEPGEIEAGGVWSCAYECVYLRSLL